MQQQLSQHRENPDIGWNEKECLKRWTMLCGPTAMDEYLLRFLRGEIQLHSLKQVQHWQQMLCALIEYMLCQGMPMEEVIPRLNFFDETRQARNSSEALLAALSSCAWVTETLSEINWPTPEAFGVWLSQLQGQRINNNNSVAFHCLNHLELQNCVLVNHDLAGANFWGASFEQTLLNGSILNDAILYGANLSKARLISARLDRAKLGGANLNESTLKYASLNEANLYGASLISSSLEGAYLNEADLDTATLDEADLVAVNLEYASLSGTRLVASDLSGANLFNANLGGAALFEANLTGANLAFANLELVSFEGACLKGANLFQANLENISWDETTHWEGVRELIQAKNVPSFLKDQNL